MSQANPVILAGLIQSWCRQDTDKDILTFVQIEKSGDFEDTTRSYRQLWSNGQRLAAWMRSQGMEKGDKFGIIMQNHPEFVDLMVASSILGTVFVPIDPRTRGDKLRYMLDFAECKGAFVAGYALAEVESAWGTEEGRWIATLDADGSRYSRIEDILAAPLPSPELAIESDDPNAPMQILYTSGTTGDPKAILSSHGRYAVSATLPAVFGLTEDDCIYTGLSLTHANAQVVSLGMILHAGIRGVISRKFTKSRLWDITRRYGCTFFNLLGGMTTAIYAEPPRADDTDNPVRLILSAGMPAAIWEDFARRFGVRLFEFYGAAEGGLTFNPTGIGPVGSCGKAPPSMQLAILDEDGNECRPGQAGEICFREADGSCPQLTYFKNPEATAEKTEGGWLHMGDVGHVDENGWLFFQYRMGGGIRKNGDFINTAFVEKALSEIDSVSDVFVYGAPISKGLAPGEKQVIASVVPLDYESFDSAAVFSACREKLDANSVPDFIQVVRKIPKTASEKPQERFLLEALDIEADNVFKQERRS
ncbi:MAG: AMP-binding protein [Xanthomonadales bacterium]|nr:AMP-binding protein [Gammaproteobacteria bacterium]NND56269.1 AMP-binding protein [Xanthomonadales bacterium]NNK52345.1 AMP-binding protein [Xanthomonadales bacterium]NNL94290.1 AMP-binding protein [Xanthomonadales bacterium]